MHLPAWSDAQKSRTTAGALLYSIFELRLVRCFGGDCLPCRNNPDSSQRRRSTSRQAPFNAFAMWPRLSAVLCSVDALGTVQLPNVQESAYRSMILEPVTRSFSIGLGERHMQRWGTCQTVIAQLSGPTFTPSPVDINILSCFRCCRALNAISMRRGILEHNDQRRHISRSSCLDKE